MHWGKQEGIQKCLQHQSYLKRAQILWVWIARRQKKQNTESTSEKEGKEMILSESYYCFSIVYGLQLPLTVYPEAGTMIDSLQTYLFISVNLHSCLVWWLLFISFSRWENQNPEKLGNWPKVTQLIIRNIRISSFVFTGSVLSLLFPLHP